MTPIVRHARELRLGSCVAGRYRLVADLSAGTTNRVCRAWDVRRNCYVVVKFGVKTNVSALPRHLRVVPVLSSGRHDGWEFVVMPFLGGGTLAQRLPTSLDRLVVSEPPNSLWLWLPQVAEAIDFLHNSCFVHGDVKPSNILFDGSGAPYLSDFDALGPIESDTKQGGVKGISLLLGTADYLAPECFHSQRRTPRSDQYALAVSVYESIAGRRPFESLVAADLARAHGVMVPDSLSKVRPGVPEASAAAINRGLAKDPSLRFETCVGFARAVLASLQRPTFPETIRLTCPHCCQLLSVGPESAGRSGSCPQCKSRIVIAEDLQSLVDPAERGKQGKLPPKPILSRWKIDSRLRRGAKVAGVIAVIMLLLTSARGQRREVTDRVERVQPPVLENFPKPPAGDAAVQPGPPPREPDAQNKAVAIGEVRENAVRETPQVRAERPPPVHEQSDQKPPAPRLLVMQKDAVRLPQADDPPQADEQQAMNAVVREAAKLAMPSEEEAIRVVEAMRDSLRSEYEQASRMGHSLVLVDRLLVKAKESEDPMTRFAALAEAERLALRDQRLDVVVECIRERAKSFDCDAVASQRAAVKAMVEGGGLWNPRIAHEALFLAYASLDSGEFDLAEDAIGLARRAAGAVESQAVAKQLQEEVDAAASRLLRRRHHMRP